MNKYVKQFLIRGLLFGGFGPIIAGFVFMIIDFAGTELNLEGWQIFLAITTSYLLAFISAGASIFEQIEEWSTIKSTLIHCLTIYAIYLITYLVNSWIPLKWEVILIFSIGVIGGFFLIWLIIYLINKQCSKSLNKKLR